MSKITKGGNISEKIGQKKISHGASPVVRKGMSFKSPSSKVVSQSSAKNVGGAVGAHATAWNNMKSSGHPSNEMGGMKL